MIQLPAQTDPLAIILKLAGDSCNINCYYCYEKRKPYAEKSLLQPETLRSFLQTCGGRPLSVELHGGEPLIVGQSWMGQLLAVLREYLGVINLSIQTNGTLLTMEWLKLFEREWPQIEMGLSLDGDPPSNAHRVDYRDRPTHERVERAFKLCHQLGRQIGVISVVTREALPRAREIIDYFSYFDAIRYLKFAPCLDFGVRSRAMPAGNRESLIRLNPSGSTMPGWATSPAEYASFLIDAFRAWRESRAYERFLLEPFASIVRALAGRSTPFCHFSDQKCAFVLTIYPDGRVGSCDELSMPGAFLSRVGQFDSIDEVISFQTNRALHQNLDGVLAKCVDCSYQPICRGGCLATRVRYSGTPYDDEYCGYRIRVIDFVAKETGQAPLAKAGVAARLAIAVD